ncbi:MAG: Amuc_1098 family type IV pilus outer membrane protein [Verrucomicrobiales bacterium]
MARIPHSSLFSATLRVAMVVGLAWGAGKSVGQDGKAGDASQGIAGLAQSQSARMQENAKRAQSLLQLANADVDAKDYDKAMESYRQSMALVPPVPALNELRGAIFAQYQRGSLVYAKNLAEGARYEDAEKLLVRTLQDARDAGVPASAINPDIRSYLAKLKSGDGFEPAMTPQHLENTKTVTRFLVEANAYYDLGEYDKALQKFQSVLQIDRYNEAAMHGMEVVNRQQQQYYEVARNHARSQMTKEVAKAWEMPKPPGTQLLGAVSGTPGFVPGTLNADLETKMNRMIIPSVDFQATPLRDVVTFLTQQSVALDTSEADPTKRGISIIIQDQAAADRPVSLQLSQAPFAEVLRYAAQFAGLRYRVDGYVVALVPMGESPDAALVTKTYQVPPGFLNAQNNGAAAPNDDPFGKQAAGNAGTLVKRVSAEDFLKQSGIEFPPGATVTYVAGSNSLIVRNTPRNLEMIEQMILGAKDAGSKSIRVDLKLLIVSEVVLKEMGFDWLLGQFNVPGSKGVFAGGGTSGNQRAVSATDFTFTEPGAVQPVGQNPVTSGLRSGSGNVVKFGIDELLNSGSPSATSTPAPGVLSIAGAFSDPQFQVMIRALDQKKGTDTLANTGVVLKPGQKADIRHIREFIYPTEYDPPELPTGSGAPTIVTPANPTAFETREVGNILEVEADVSADNLSVNLGVTVDMTEFDGFINYGSPILAPVVQGGIATLLTENRIIMPVFEAIKETTQVTAYDGATILIGGLLTESVTDAEDKIPLLGDLPYVCKAFRSSIEQRTKRVLMLFVTPHILDPSGAPFNQVQQTAVR